MRKQVDFTGWTVSENGVGISKDKIEAADKLESPTTLAGVKSLLGFTSFLRAHIPYYCEVVGPIQALLSEPQAKYKSKFPTLWNAKHETAMEMLRSLLKDNRVLAFPDPTKRFTLYTDASQYHMSAVLMQGEPPKAIGYWSKSFKGSQLNWSALVKEARAVMEAVLFFEVYLTGCEITLKCDHKPLEGFLKRSISNRMVNDWSQKIQSFDITFEWVRTDHNVSDCLSRLVATELFTDHDKATDNFETFDPKPKSAPKNDKFTRKQKLRIARKLDTALKRDETELVNTLTAVVENEKYEGELPFPLPADPRDALIGLNPAETACLKPTRVDRKQFLLLQAEDAYCQRLLKDKGNFAPHTGRFTKINSLLYKLVDGGELTQSRLDSLALVIPKVLRLTVVVNTHLENGHPGRDRMMQLLRTKVFWKNMLQQVTQFVRGCGVCRAKTIKPDTYPLIHVTPPFGPGMRIAADCWSASPNHHYLTAIDMHSMWPWIERVENKDAKCVKQAFLNIFASTREPVEILTDNGPEFRNKEVDQFFKSLKVHHRTTLPNSPNENGVIERFHRFLNQQLRATGNFRPDGDLWPALNAALTAYRRTPHTSTAESPLFLHTGRDPIFTIDHLLPTRPREVWNAQRQCYDLAELRYAYALARKNTCLARRKNRVLKPTCKQPITVGCRVYKRNQSSTKGKLDPNWIPGFRVIEMPSSRECLVENTKTGNQQRISVKFLKWADPVSELLDNSEIDVFPGRSKMYFHSKDLPNLHWPAMKEYPMDADTDDRLAEAVRDRESDTSTQKVPTPSLPTDAEPSVEGEGTRTGRPQREKKLPKRYDDMVMAITECEILIAHIDM
jgi:hypothetical protein